MNALTHFITREYEGIQPTKTPEQLVAWLRSFHEKLAERLHNREDVLDLIPE